MALQKLDGNGQGWLPLSDLAFLHFEAWHPRHQTPDGLPAKERPALPHQCQNLQEVLIMPELTFRFDDTSEKLEYPVSSRYTLSCFAPRQYRNLGQGTLLCRNLSKPAMDPEAPNIWGTWAQRVQIVCS